MMLSIRWKVALGTILTVACSLAVAGVTVEHSLILALGGAFLVALILSFWLSHTITTPLSDLTHAARQLAAGQQTSLMNSPTHDEIGLLASTLEDAADRLHAQIDVLSEDRAQLLRGL